MLTKVVTRFKKDRFIVTYNGKVIGVFHANIDISAAKTAASSFVQGLKTGYNIGRKEAEIIESIDFSK